MQVEVVVAEDKQLEVVVAEDRQQELDGHLQ